jgi:hypothetical protein
VVAAGFKPQDIAATLDRLSVDEVQAMRRASQHAAGTLNADVEMQKVVDLYAGLWNDRPVSHEQVLPVRT